MKNTIGARLRDLRGALSQSQFARKVGVKQTSYSGWEADLKVPAATTLAQIANALGVSTDWILGLTSDRVGHSASALAPETAQRIAELERENSQLKAVNAALMEAFKNIGRGATSDFAPATIPRRSAL